MIALLFARAALAASCAGDTIDELERTMNSVLEAHSQVDELAFDSSQKLMDAAVICLDTVPPPTTLARLHHTMALRSFVNGQTRATKRSLAALRLLDPRWEPPFPGGHPFTQMWNEATDPGPVEPIGTIKPKVWIVDAVERDEVPTERAFLLQVRQETGEIRLNRYLYDPEDLPDMGQNRTTDLGATPWTTSVRLLGVGRLVGQRQQVEPAAALDPQQASTLGGGGTVQLRITPTATLGMEGTLSVLPADDVVAGQGVGVEGQLVGLVGSGLAPVAGGVWFVAGRLGLATDTSRSWPRAAAGIVPQSHQLVGPSLGVETGLRHRERLLDLTIDAALASATVPWLLDAEVGFTQLLGESLGLRASLGGRSDSQPLVDAEATAGRAGTTELRAQVGLDIVL